jgi:glyoxylase-like metal-dependent hydrolase (beta-lactamase superfamily II)
MCTPLHSGHDLPQRALRVHEEGARGWEHGHEKFSRQPFEDSVLPVIAAGQAELVTNGFALDDQVWLEPTPGHTPDHVAICLASRRQRAVMCGDIMHSPTHCFHPQWTAWPDWDAAPRTPSARDGRSSSATATPIRSSALPAAGRVVPQGNAFRFRDDAVDW